MYMHTCVCIRVFIGKFPHTNNSISQIHFCIMLNVFKAGWCLISECGGVLQWILGPSHCYCIKPGVEGGPVVALKGQRAADLYIHNMPAGASRQLAELGKWSFFKLCVLHLPHFNIKYGWPFPSKLAVLISILCFSTNSKYAFIIYYAKGRCCRIRLLVSFINIS